MGLIYSLINVRSPASPVVALLGMLLGEQIIPIGKQVLANDFSISWFSTECAPKITGVDPPVPPQKEEA